MPLDELVMVAAVTGAVAVVMFAVMLALLNATSHDLCRAVLYALDHPGTRLVVYTRATARRVWEGWMLDCGLLLPDDRLAAPPGGLPGKVAVESTPDGRIYIGPP